jgi:phosphate transport system protein
MHGYEQRLAEDKAEIRRRVVAIGQRVRLAVETAVASLLALDHAACSRVILGDLPINREIRAIDHLCHRYIARHLPSAGHLRFVSSVLQMNIALERIGDYAVTISREGAQLSSAPPPTFAEPVRELAHQADYVLTRALSAFSEQNAELARQTRPQATAADRTFGQIYRTLTEQGGELPLADAFALLTVCHRLERVSDQAKNICEETVFELAGETKPPKRYRILFVDARDTLAAPLAVALARKAFPESGDYSSAGFQPGKNLAPELVALADELSLDLDGLEPVSLSQEREYLSQFDVIVGLVPDVRLHLERVPYTTVLVQWQLPRLADAGRAEALSQRLRQLSQHLSNEIHDLMVTMRGEGAG